MTLTLNDPDLLRQQAYIDGQWVDADSGATFPVIDPATGYVYGSPADSAALAQQTGAGGASGAQAYTDNASWGRAAVN